MTAKNWQMGKGEMTNIRMLKLLNAVGSDNGRQQRSTPSTSRGASRDQGARSLGFSQGCSWNPQKIKSHLKQQAPWRTEDRWHEAAAQRPHWGSKESQRPHWRTEWHETQRAWNQNIYDQHIQPSAWQEVDDENCPPWAGVQCAAPISESPSASSAHWPSASSAQNAVTIVQRTVHEMVTLTRTTVTPQPPPQTQSDSPDKSNAVTPRGSVRSQLQLWARKPSAKRDADTEHLESIKKETDETASVTENGAQSTEHGAQGSAGEKAQVDDNVIMDPIDSAHYETGDWSVSCPPSPALSHVSEAALYESSVYESVSDKEDEAMAAATVRSHTPPVQGFANLSEFHAVAAMVTQGVAEASPEGNERRTRQRVQPPSLPLAPPPGLSVAFEEC